MLAKSGLTLVCSEVKRDELPRDGPRGLCENLHLPGDSWQILKKTPKSASNIAEWQSNDSEFQIAPKVFADDPSQHNHNKDGPFLYIVSM